MRRGGADGFGLNTRSHARRGKRGKRNPRTARRIRLVGCAALTHPTNLLRGRLGIDDGQAFARRHVAQAVVRTDEVIERCLLMEVQSHGELEGVQGANLASESVASDEVLSPVVVRGQEPNKPIPPAGDIAGEAATQPSEALRVERPGADLDREYRDGLNQGQPGDDQLGPGSLMSRSTVVVPVSAW